jgi:hypothetical protein
MSDMRFRQSKGTVQIMLQDSISPGQDVAALPFHKVAFAALREITSKNDGMTKLEKSSVPSGVVS